MLSGQVHHKASQLNISVATSKWSELAQERKPIYHLSILVGIYISRRLNVGSIPRNVWERIWKKQKSEPREKWYPGKKSQERRLKMGWRETMLLEPSLQRKASNISRQEIPLMMHAAAGISYGWVPKSADRFFLVQKLNSAVRILFFLLSWPCRPSWWLHPGCNGVNIGHSWHLYCFDNEGVMSAWRVAVLIF